MPHTRFAVFITGMMVCFISLGVACMRKTPSKDKTVIEEVLPWDVVRDNGKVRVVAKRWTGRNWNLRQIADQLIEQRIPKFYPIDQNGIALDMWLNGNKSGNTNRDVLLEANDVVLLFAETFTDTKQLVNVHRYGSRAKAEKEMNLLEQGATPVYPGKTLYCVLWGNCVFWAVDKFDYILAVSGALP